jgi:hypothetical protein
MKQKKIQLTSPRWDARPKGLAGGRRRAPTPGSRPRNSSKLPPFTVGGWLAVAEVRLEEVAVLRRHWDFVRRSAWRSSTGRRFAVLFSPSAVFRKDKVRESHWKKMEQCKWGGWQVSRCACHRPGGGHHTVACNFNIAHEHSPLIKQFISARPALSPSIMRHWACLDGGVNGVNGANLPLWCQTCGANVVGQMFCPLIPFTPKR